MNKFKRAATNMNTYYIYSEEEGYWNNDFGWTENKDGATIFSEKERNTFDLPLTCENDAEWKVFQ
jgi:hypothetical protein